MKTADGMPWGDQEALDEVIGNGGVYVAASEGWFRGVWEPAPQQIMSADYTAKQLQGVTGNALLGDGGDSGDSGDTSV